jgi:signal transduction histidine kinase
MATAAGLEEDARAAPAAALAYPSIGAAASASPLAAIPGDTLRPLVYAEQVRTAYGAKPALLPSTVIPNIAVALFLVAVMWGKVAGSVLLLWFGVQLAYQLVRVVVNLRYWRANPPLDQAWRWARLYTWQTTCNGFIWASAGVVMFVSDSITYQAVLFATLCGFAAASVTITAMLLPSFLGSVLPVMTVITVRTFMEGNATHYALGGMLAVFGAYIVSRGINMHGVLVESLRQRFENLELVRRLTEQTEIAEAAKREAQEADLAKSRFLAAASHDLRQPLHALSLFSGALAESRDLGEIGKLTGHINASVAALELLFNSLLDVSRLDAGVVQARPRDFRAAVMLDRVRNDYAPLAREKGLKLVVARSSAVLRSDPLLLEQLLRNLAANAIRYTEEGGVAIGCRPRTQGGVKGYVLEVRDSGIGIPPEQHEHIFAEFVQLGNQERDRTKGLGLGLAIVRRLSLLLETPVALKSAPGRGALFSVFVPRGETPAAVAAAEEPPRRDLLKGVRVLVIDDEAAVRTGMQALLSGWGCEARAFEGCEAALAGLGGWQPHIIFADYRLRAGENGIETLNRLRAGREPAPPGVIVTGDNAAAEVKSVSASGYHVLYKPVAPAKLRALMQSLLRAPV